MTVKRSDLRGFAKREAGKEVAIGAEAADMRAVVIVEFWAMMGGCLPYGWEWCITYPSEHEQRFLARGPGVCLECDIKVVDSWSHYEAEEALRADAWAADYRRQPRLEQ